MRIVTWNVLHRVHAETHGEPAIVQWADEAARVKRVAQTLLELNADVALLQEVSGDLLKALRAAFPARAVHNHVYPRLPRRSSSQVRDATEHLVVIAPDGSKVRRATTYESDPGKGWLAVEVAGASLVVVSTHVSWGDKRAEQLRALRDGVGALGAACVVGGDFNVEREVVAPALGVACAPLADGSLPTRDDERGQGLFIDHLLALHGARVGTASVVAHVGESDHRPVVAEGS